MHYQINGTSIEDIHKVLFDILLEVDRICKKNKIKYFLSGGSLLGAIRHSGFIPWDDDLDIWMVRKEFKKFKKCLKKDLNQDLFISEDYFSNKFYPLSILKIKRKETVFIEKEFSHLPIAHMLYLDIFPLDRTNKFWFPIQCAFLTKCQSIRMFLLDSNKKQFKKSKRFFYSFFSLKSIRLLTEFFCRMLNPFHAKFYAQLCHRAKYWPLFKKIETEKLILHQFESGLFPIPFHYDSILKRCYNNYLDLPPVEKRAPTHDVVSCKILYKLNDTTEK